MAKRSKGKLGGFNVKRAKQAHKAAKTGAPPAPSAVKLPKPVKQVRPKAAAKPKPEVAAKENRAKYGSKEHHRKIGEGVAESWKRRRRGKGKLDGINVKKARANHANARKWIKDAIKHPGALHKELHVPEGQKIPAAKLAEAAHSPNRLLRLRAHLAQTLKHMNPFKHH